MSTAIVPQARKPAFSLPVALWLIVLIWIIFTTVYTLEWGEALSALLEFLPGLLGVGVLLAAGFSFSDCFLRYAPLSRRGLVWLGISFLLMPGMWLTGRWVGWHPVQALVYAPASGISQELFFRAALLPVLLAVFWKRGFPAILIQALLFGLWHVPTTYFTAPLAGVIAVFLVTFLCGIFWAKQVQQDGTVIWLMIYHSILLVVNSFFTW